MCCEFLVARSDAAKLLELIEEAFNQISGLVAMDIIVAEIFAVRSRRNDRLGMVRLDAFDQRIGVISLVGNHGAGFGRVIEQGWRLVDIRLFGTGQCEADGIAKRIDDAMDFGAKSAARATQSLWAVFFLAPAACW